MTINQSGTELESGKYAAISPTFMSIETNWQGRVKSRRQHISQLTRKILLDTMIPTDQEVVASAVVPHVLSTVQKSTIETISDGVFTSSKFEKSLPDTPRCHKETFFAWLRSKGYTILVDKLSKHSGYPWDEIQRIRSPILIEQLVDIYLLSCRHTGNAEDLRIRKIMNFAFNLIQLASLNTHDHLSSYELIDDTKHIFGELIYLIDQNFSTACQAIQEDCFKTAVQNLHNEFDAKIYDILVRLQTHYLSHYETQLQMPELAVNNRIPVEIARAILTEIGTINVGIIDTLADIFLVHDKPIVNHGVNLAYALKILQRSPKLRSEFESIGSPDPASQEIIKVSLDLDMHAIVNATQARTTALIAILSHLRQESDTVCFAVSLAIENLSMRLGYCLKDMQQLLNIGKLTRQINHIKKDIPFMMRIADDNLNKKIFFDYSGRIISQNNHLGEIWQAPGLQAACRVIGINDHIIALKTIISELSNQSTGQIYSMAVKDLLNKLCEYAKKKKLTMSTDKAESLYLQACFAFSSQTSQPLLKIWENAIANMSEAEEGSMIKTSIIKSVLYSLQLKLDQLAITPSLIIQRVLLFIQKNLYERIQLRYSPITSYEESHSQKSMQQVGFVLYDENRRVDRSQGFIQFIDKVMSSVNETIRDTKLSQEENSMLTQLMGILQPYIHVNSFMGYLLAHYHPDNKAILRKIPAGMPIPYSLVKFTPWITTMGNRSKTVLKIYFEASKQIEAEEFSFKNAEDALIKIIDICKRMPEEEKKIYIDNPNKRIPCCILGKHRLPFIAGHPSLAHAWMDKSSTKDWIENHVKHHGKEIANTLVDRNFNINFLKFLKQKNCLDITEKNTHIFFDQIEKTHNTLILIEYRTHILQLYQQIFLNHPSDNFIRDIDTTLYASLEPSLKKQLENSAVHFADTNWHDGVNDINLCFAINPGTGKLALWEAHADGTHLKILDEAYWLFNQTWEFFKIPKDVDDDIIFPAESVYF